MMRIAIRDDDTGFFTNHNDLMFVYKEIDDFPISFAVVPFVTDVQGGCPETAGNIERRGIADNNELVDYLKQLVLSGKGEILMHGITHQYKFVNNAKKLPEILWKDISELRQELIYTKQYMENTFGCKIKCFVAPSNKITKQAVSEIAKIDMDFSGITQHFDRQISFRYISNYVKRWTVRAVYGIPYPGVLDYGTHFEINACGLYSKEYLLKMYFYCKKRKQPMTINTHYWHLRDNPQIRKWFIEFIKYTISDGATPSTISQCIDSR